MKISPRPIVIGLLSILALSLAAATLTSPVDVDGDLGVGGEADRPEPGEGQEIGVPIDTADSDEIGGLPTGVCVEPLTAIPPEALLGAFILLGVVLALLVRGPGVAVVAVVVGFWTIVAAIVLLTAGCPDGFIGDSLITGGDSIDFEEGTPLTEETNGSAQPVSVPSLLLLAVVAIGLVGIVLGLRGSDSDTTEEAVEENEESTKRTRPASVRTGTTDAAATVDDLPPENAIYEAWSAFATSLEVSRPRSKTPAEYAAAATAAGHDERAVRELTGVFQAVRYGLVAPTPARKADAVAALETIADTIDDETLRERAAQLRDDE